MGGTAEDTLDTIMDVINDKDDSCYHKIKNIMSDRCITNSCVEQKLEERMNHSLNNVKCSVHPLDTMAHDCEKLIRHTYVTIHHETGVKSPLGHFQFMLYLESICPKL